MADIKISQLPEVTSVSTGDVLPVVATGVTSKIQIQNFGGSITASNAISSSYALTASYASNVANLIQTFPYTGSAIISGSLTVTGSFNISSGLTSSLQGTASWALNAITASYTLGSITGSGAQGQITYWSASNVITGDNNLFWDTANARLGISTTTPLHKVDIRTNLSNDTAGVVISNLSPTSRVFFSASNDSGFGTSLSQYGSTNPFIEFRNNTVLASSKDLIFISDNYSSSLGSASIRFFPGGYATSQESMRLFGSTGNLLIRRGGTFVDEGYKLDVIGPTRISGSLLVVSGITGSLHGTSSWSLRSITASYAFAATTASYAITAATASSAEDFLIRGNLTASNAVFSGTITAQSIYAQYITASTEYITGSTKFGSQLTDTHQFTGSVSIINSLTVDGSLNATSSWAFNAITSSYAITASYALNSANPTDTGSFLVSASAVNTTITFTKGDGSTFDVTVSQSGSVESASYSFYAETASYANTFSVNNTILSTQQNSDVDTGTEIVASVSTSSFSSAFFDYYIQDGTNYRAGTVSSVWNSIGTVRYTDTSTTDIGDTSGLIFDVILTNSTASLQATATSNNWNIKTFVRAF
jgi:hypothetical protein